MAAKNGGKTIFGKSCQITLEKEIVFAQQKQSVSITINDSLAVTMFFCLICFSIYAKKKGFRDYCFLSKKSCHITLQIPWGPKNSPKSLYLALFPREMCFCVLHRNSRWPPNMAGKQFFRKVVSSLCVLTFCINVIA